MPEQARSFLEERHDRAMSYIETLISHQRNVYICNSRCSLLSSDDLLL